ncbi:MAG TPA: pilus assembly protein PilP [Gammaproteobacteria bacterium]|nr:pilus assembly protein PilP [Gammaproteobacteria bacterium]
MKYKYLLFFFALFFVHDVFAQITNPFSRLSVTDHPLRLYSPNQLTMVGTISQDNTILGIVKTPNNQVYTVKPGSQLGNNAYVVDVTTQKITVQQNNQMIELLLRQVK